MQFHGEEEKNKALSAFTTWEMSLQQLTLGQKSIEPDIRHFLTLVSYLAPVKVGEFMFRWYSATSPGRTRNWMCIFKTTKIDEFSSYASSDSETSSSEGFCDSSGETVGSPDDDNKQHDGNRCESTTVQPLSESIFSIGLPLGTTAPASTVRVVQCPMLPLGMQGTRHCVSREKRMISK